MNDLFFLGIPQGIAHWLWLALIAMGTFLLFTAYYFHRKSKKLSRAISRLHELNQSCNQDALDFFNQAWPVLHRSGCIKMQANIDWFGESIPVIKGTIKGIRLIKQTHVIQRDDMRFEIMVYMHREAGQLESVSSVVLKTFLNILEQDLVLKQAEILTSQKRLERYQLFVQHEIKNISQFIQLLADQVNSIQTAEAKVKLVDRLAKTIPTMAQRARKTIEHMQQPLSEFYEGQMVRLQDLISDVVRMYGLDAYVSGDTTSHLPRQLLSEVFKNILGNFRDHENAEQPLDIAIAQTDDGATISIIIMAKNEQGNEFLAERMFEPFWTTSESGMGLGLFLARELLKQMEGSVSFFQNQGSFGFVVELPSSEDVKMMHAISKSDP
ncbi:sensor histidine kinase [Thiomicrorhabdus sediminis]|uniref:histidine kinase n=1 Tax=Thiomicrorhabdus sediminis TaxID=2580412 RepID=A0A4P9K775_9GAMM|nr:HAMP domain-containing sensor histidine kinase [Thiomicrorhabdus sediminis]QCU90778.1 HAMP domain-containing histidine kinase [Thiomicrorhabdus sediminis]